MGIDSDYYKEKNKKQLTKLRMLEAKLPPYVTSYLDDKELSSQVNTVIAYAYDLQTFFRFLTEKNTMLKNTVIKDITIDFLENLTFEDINEYQRYLRFNNDDGSTHQNQDKGIARRMAALRGFFEFACTHQYMKNNPTVGAAKRIKMPQKDIIRLNDEEVNDLLNVVSNTNIKGNKLQIQKCQKTQLRDTALITLLLNTGIRVSECAGLDIDDINFNYRTINIVRKGGSDAHLYFNEITENALKDYIDKQTVKGEEKKYLGTKISEMQDNEIIKDFLAKNIISEEEYDKYYVLQDENLSQKKTALAEEKLRLQQTVSQTARRIAKLERLLKQNTGKLKEDSTGAKKVYNTYEVIDTKGYNKSDDEVLYKLTDINKKDDENTTSENDNVIEETTEKNNENEKNDEG